MTSRDAALNVFADARHWLEDPEAGFWHAAEGVGHEIDDSGHQLAHDVGLLRVGKAAVGADTCFVRWFSTLYVVQEGPPVWELRRSSGVGGVQPPLQPLRLTAHYPLLAGRHPVKALNLEATTAMKGALVLLISGVLFVAYCTPLAAADDGDEVVEEIAESRDADDDETDSLTDDDADDSGVDEGQSGESRVSTKGAHARAGHAKHARAGSRHGVARSGARPHARSGAARRAAHSR
ncbi:uncharacterized protein LOC126095401 [Schistocerca cancellata]|uniref:uncharacterized protein LOC126095401 n=1 Tax=Schistocerca cancellata TaxID=274614 RepID=UPI0021178AB5|nr:uncharacterized protein LOC126095401 [Schistocerca cancellata]